MRTSQRLVMAFVAVLFVPCSTALASAVQGEVGASSAKVIEPGDDLRVSLIASSGSATESHMIEGSFVAKDDVVLTLEVDGEPVSIPMDEIARITRHEGDPVTNGLLMGAGIGAAGGAIAVSAVYAGEEPGSWFVPTAEEQIIGGLVLGGVLGAAIGLIADAAANHSSDEIVYSAVDFDLGLASSGPKFELVPTTGPGSNGLRLVISF